MKRLCQCERKELSIRSELIDSNYSYLISTVLIAGAEPIASEKRIENSDRASILNSVSRIAQIKVTPRQLISY